MSKPALVLVHGRGQGGHDPDDLRRIWLAALRQGLGTDADRVLEGVEVRFPYYGDALDAWVARTGERPDALARGGADIVNRDLLTFQARVAGEVLARHGIDAQAEAARLLGADRGAPVPRSPEWLRAVFRLLDRLPGATGTFISLVMRDVHLYLNNPGAARAVDDIVGRVVRGRCIVVAHSLGSVVAYRLLASALKTQVEVPLFLTLGSPLGIGPIRDALAPRRFPAAVETWVNAFDDRDDVALFPLGQGRFPVEPRHPIEDVAGIDNRTDNHHGISEYLNKAEIAGRIAAAL